MTNFEKHVRLVEGRFADPTAHVIRPEELQQGAQALPSGILPQNLTVPNFEIEALIGVRTALNFTMLNLVTGLFSSAISESDGRRR